MKGLNYLFLEFFDAYKTIKRHKFRAMLSALGIILGSASLIAMLSIGEGAKNNTLKSIESLGIDSIIIKNKASEQNEIQQKKARGLNLDDYLSLKENLPKISMAALREREGALQTFEGAKLSNLLAVTANYANLRHLKLIKGKFFSELNEKYLNPVCVLGHKVSKQLGMQGQVGASLLIGGAPFEVIGILASRSNVKGNRAPIESRDLDASIFIPIGTEKSISLKNAETKGSEVSEVHLKVREKKNLQAIAALSGRMIKKRHGGIEDVDFILPIELMHQAEESQRTFNLVLGGVAAMALLVGGVGIMNIMLATVAERTREIGIRRAFGASRKDILRQFLFEALILTLAGGALGIGFGMILATFIGYFSSWSTIVTSWSISLAMGMSSIVGLIAGLYPANKAASVDPIQALKSESLRN